MRYSCRFLLLFTFLICASCPGGKKKSLPDDVEGLSADVDRKIINLADPTIFYHDGTHDLYGTSQGDLAERGKGFLVFTSTDLKNWEGPTGANNGFALKAGDAFGSKVFWERSCRQ